MLQNGGFLDDYKKPLGWPRTVTMGPKKASLVMPYYPMAEPITLGSIKGPVFRMLVNPGWHGFLTDQGVPKEITPDLTQDQYYQLKKGDYATITKGDLTVLIKVKPEKKVPVTPLSAQYRGKLLSLWLGGPKERQSLGLGVLGAAVLVSAFVYSLLIKEDDRPKHKMDLEDKYNLAFVHPGHIKNLPEALQVKLDRTNYLQQAMTFYQDLSTHFLGLETFNSEFLYPDSMTLYQRRYDEYESDIKDLLAEDREGVPKETDLAQMVAKIAVPAVVGESFDASLLRLTGKLKSLHKVFHDSLQQRRVATKEFQEDVTYGFEVYRQELGKAQTENVFSGINAFNLIRNEDAMYQEAEALAVKAYVEQKKIHQSREPITPLTKANTSPLGLKSPHPSLTILSDLQFSTNDKLSHLRASIYGTHRKKKVQEPLIGKLNPDLIEKVINRHKFELKLCFELALRRNRALSGAMEWQWRLDSRGKISDLKLLNSSIKDQGMHQCVRKKIASWTFPRPQRGSVQITYPFRFRPNRG